MLTEGRTHYDHRDNENNPNKRAGNVLGSAITWDSDGGCRTDNSIPPTKANSKNLEKGHNRIWVKVEKVDSKFNMTKIT